MKKISLMAFGIVVGLSLSVSAAGLAGPMAATVHHQQHHQAPPWIPKSLQSVYQYDDGTAEDAVVWTDFTSTFEALWFNQFNVISGQNTIESVEIGWGFPGNSVDPSGTPVTIAIWSDPNGDGDPHDAVLLGSVDGVIQNANTDTLVKYTFATPVTVPGTSFFVGDMNSFVANQVLFLQGIDYDTVTGKSWVAGNNDETPIDIQNPGNNDNLATIDSFGIVGTWLIRANPSTGGNIVLQAAVRRQHGNHVVALRWSPADGGSVNILRNGVVLHGPTDDDGSAQDNVGHHSGTVTYQVCETDTGNCSNEVTVTIHPPGN